ncbi:protein kinase domain protein [Gregarina niphandrodes]|uniref:non-specific serine/threonine protein kinase n=1 Tax=Gregarina niphandrodes TaxID=110365 RepID=A0A023B7J6_GRENI|nr:protein kinase domain protein [Gregarina niphandrodes]EZG67509.1 protein kinase domain protein [Gregarina niphandrodes]|eukprot:XP_011130224.1 protein kinase domain protein [Gregarina niphandrodes]
MGCTSCKPVAQNEMKGGALGSPQSTGATATELADIKKNLAPLSCDNEAAKTEGKPPAYHVRRSIATARVHIGSTEQVYEKYELSDEILGTGVSGIVRIARDRVTGVRYAIKTLSLQNISPKKAAMLHNEVNIYLKLDHPNIAKLIEVFEDDKRIFVVMELCTGGELYDRLAAKKRYSEADAIKVTTQMLEAINYCHGHSICHRDLKLENWVYSNMSEDAELKLIDFGFSRIFSPVVPMTAMHGTVYYVSPEVMDGCYREKCDIWSLGVIVYMLLSGSPPFNGNVDYQILMKIRNAQYDFNSPVWNTISPSAKRFIEHLLVKDPTQRPSAKQALQHPWLQDAHTVDNEISLDVLHSIKQFAEANTLKRAAAKLVAYSFTSHDVKDLQQEFRKLDDNQSGTISMTAFVQAVTSKLKISTEEAETIFHRIDPDDSKEVQYTSFLAATLHAKLTTDDHWVREAFDLLDADRSGLITVKDLRDVLGDTFGQIPVEQIMSQATAQGTGLTYEAVPTNSSQHYTLLTIITHYLSHHYLSHVHFWFQFRSLIMINDESKQDNGPDRFPIESRASFSNAVVELQLGGQNK